ncbi:DUF3953 domain-containing protein [Halobacillus locisalis]|uniref:DUF3953 domain-containing protein n=1 Tax=Halobacillus locisalis TaxID=220753 RepID=A0A838CTN0_9BACI|nr:DUF3953 domain-containing protein [Halobacillus locisalis]MBA2175427.1 DUF3953 domain-containing protein [Halobacillus locisalis]
MKLAKLILGIVVFSLAGYGLIIEDPADVMPYTMLFLGCYMLVMGVDEFKKMRHSYIGYALTIIGLFGLFVSVQAFLVT